MQFTKAKRRRRIQNRVRRHIRGTAERPRLNVHRSNTHIYAQLIDDLAGHTLVSASTLEKALNIEGTRIDQAGAVGKLLAERARSQNIERVVFDRAGYLYHGRVKSLADGAREGGLNF